MKTARDGVIIFLGIGLCLLVSKLLIIIPNIDYNIKRATDYILSTQEIVSGQHDELKELRDITDEFRAQIKGLQKEVLIGIQEGGM